jgi:NAD(P)-dependent dehydrogenase (short-subunit alcohol dehydrogenase family)
MAMKTLALEWKPSAITVCMLHPGWVRTDMGGSNAAIGTTQSASGLLNVIDGLSIADTGCFFDQQGAVIPW